MLIWVGRVRAPKGVRTQPLEAVPVSLDAKMLQMGLKEGFRAGEFGPDYPGRLVT